MPRAAHSPSAARTDSAATRAASRGFAPPPVPPRRGSRGSREVPLDLCGGASGASDRDARDDSECPAPRTAAGPARSWSRRRRRASTENRVGEARDPSLPRTRPSPASGDGSQRRSCVSRHASSTRSRYAPSPRLSRRPSRPPRPRARRPARARPRATRPRRAGQGPPPRRATRAPGARTAGGVAGGGVRVAAREGASCQRRRCTHHRRACAGHRYVQRGAHGLPVIGRALQDRAPVLHGARRVRRAQNRGLRGAQPVSLGGHGHALYAQGAFQELERLFALPTLTQNARVHQARLAVAHRATRLELRAHRRRQLHERGVARGSVGVAGGGVAVPRLEQSAADGPHDVLRVVAQSVQLHRARLLLDERPAARVRLEQRPQVLRVARLRLGGGFEHGHRLLRPSRVLVEKRQRVQHGIVPRAFQSHGLAQVHSLVVPAHALQNDPLQHASDLHRGELAQQLAIDGLQRRFVVSAVDHLVDGLELAVEGHVVHLLGAPRGLRLAHLADRGGRRRRPR